MTKTLATLSMGLLFSWTGWTAPQAVDARRFIEGIQGTYKIQLAGGQKPKEENTAAEVFADHDEGIFTMPFCGTNGLCDPGYIDLAYPNTQVTFEDLGAGHTSHSISVKSGAKTFRYTWDDDHGTVTFTNYQYKIGSQITQLTHVLKKAP